jgi:hypothetical protein
MGLDRVESFVSVEKFTVEICSCLQLYFSMNKLYVIINKSNT